MDKTDYILLKRGRQEQTIDLTLPGTFVVDEPIDSYCYRLNVLDTENKAFFCKTSSNISPITELDTSTSPPELTDAEISDFSFPARAAEQADIVARKVLEEAVNAEQLVKNLWNGAWKACSFYHLPKWLQDNDFLYDCHRPPLQSYTACFLSIFKIHTETGNIWTHLVGCLLFIVVATYFMLMESVPWSDKVVFLIFFASVILCLAMSSVYHTVCCHSEQVSDLSSKLDYTCIALLIVGSFIPWLHFGFYCDYKSRIFYLVLINVLAVLSVACTLGGFLSGPQSRGKRALVFVIFGLSGVIPALHYIIARGFNQAVQSASLGWLCLMAVLYILGAILYALRIPERLFPGKCDVWFQSHQIFHILVIIAAFVHYHGISKMAFHTLSDNECKIE